MTRMTKGLVAAGVFVTALLVGSYAQSADKPPTLEPTVETSGGCTAFYIGDNRFLTAGHCVNDAVETVTFQDKTKTRIEPFFFADVESGMNDFAVFKIEKRSSYFGKKIKPLELDCLTELEIGDTISTEGYPTDLGFSRRSGEIIGKEAPWVTWKQPVGRMDVTATYGASGSPILKAGKVVGILVGGEPNTNLVVYQPIKPVCEALGYAR